MGTRTFTEQRLNAFLAEVVRLKQSEFPYVHSEDALRALESQIQISLGKITALPPNAAQNVVNQRCAVEMTQALDYHFLMGFLLRSTNTRNSFEVFRPLLRMSRSLLQAVGVAPDDVRVLLSSEWDYSPYVVQLVPYLKGYVLVGMPATESSNPLILPLAGHELGHTVWEEGKLENGVRQDILNILVQEVAAKWVGLGASFPMYATMPAKSVAQIAADMFLMDVVKHAYRLAASQLQETFCDFLGLQLFGESYLFAYAYLISPSWGEYRAISYPNTRTRAENLVRGCHAFGLNAPANYSDWFENLPLSSPTASDQFVVELADACLDQLVPWTAAEVSRIVTTAGFQLPSSAEETRIRQRIDKLVPADTTLCLGDIINAGWSAHNDPGLWSHLSWEKERKLEVLKDLILKSIEIQDVESIKAAAGNGP